MVHRRGRDRIIHREDRFFALAFLGSGLLFVAMLFTATAITGTLVSDESLRSRGEPGPTILALGRRLGGLQLQDDAMRMAAVFTMSTSVTALRTGVASRSIGRLGVGIADAAAAVLHQAKARSWGDIS